MNVWFELWLCMGFVALIVDGKDLELGRALVRAFLIAAPAATGIIHAIHEIFK